MTIGLAPSQTFARAVYIRYTESRGWQRLFALLYICALVNSKMYREVAVKKRQP